MSKVSSNWEGIQFDLYSKSSYGLQFYPIGYKQVVSTLSREKAIFAHTSDIFVNTHTLFSNQIFELLLRELAVNDVTRKLAFKWNTLEEQQAIKLMQALETNETLESLELLYKASSASAAAIAGLLKKNKRLKKIHIECNNEGAKALADSLKENSSLQKLDLSFNKIGDEGAEALAEALRVNKSLRELDLSHNNIGNAGAEALAGALGVNTNLQKLNLSSNNKITETALKHFCRALEVNRTLTAFEIYNQNINLYDNVVDHLRSFECEYNKPDGRGIKNAYSKPPAKDYITSIEKAQDGGEGGKQLGDNSLKKISPSAVYPDGDLKPMGENSDLESSDG